MVDGKGAHRTARTIEIGNLIACIQVFPGGVNTYPRRVTGLCGKPAPGQLAGAVVHVEQVDSLSVCTYIHRAGVRADVRMKVAAAIRTGEGDRGSPGRKRA